MRGTIIIKKLEEKKVETYIPKVCVVETAAVTKRLSDKDLARRISEGVFNSYELVDEAILFNIAWRIATETGCSGFDSYFIALARIEDAILFTDDGKMHSHAEEAGVSSVLIRKIDLEGIIDILEKM